MARRPPIPPEDLEPGALVLASVEIDGLTPLGPRAVLRLSPRVTVLIGRNGAGKSALMESIQFCAHLATGLTALRGVGRWRDVPDRFRCDFTLHGRRLIYEFKIEDREVDAGSDKSTAQSVWSERCWDPLTSETLWTVEDAIARAGNSSLSLQSGTGLLCLKLPVGFSSGDVVGALGAWLKGVSRIQAGVPRAEEVRDLTIQTREEGSGVWPVVGQSRVETVASALLNWSEREPDTLAEFEAIGRRLGIWHRVDVDIIRRPHGPEVGRKAREFGLVDVDGVNIGNLSDGTLRVAEILRLLLTPSKLLLIEELETSVHPGLLRRLLAEIAAYSHERQTVMSTHSPQVVTTVDPNEIRLVHREHGVTSVASLTEEQTAQITDYLQDEGTLGDFVFSGAVE